MARHASRRSPLEEAIRLRDEAARLHAKLDGLVQALVAEQAAGPAEDAAQRSPDAQVESSTRDDRLAGASCVEGPGSPGTGGTSAE
jgi:hypothetical protein